MTKGMKVTARESQCIGIIPTTWAYAGTIEKINKKSIVVRFSHMTRTFGSKVEADMDYAGSERFAYWNTTEDGRVIYKSRMHGIIEF